MVYEAAAYQPVVEYRKGKDNPSDYLSRQLQVSETSPREELVAEECEFYHRGKYPKGEEQYSSSRSHVVRPNFF